jgi:hypothetical protein
LALEANTSFSPRKKYFPAVKGNDRSKAATLGVPGISPDGMGMKTHFFVFCWNTWRE